MVKTTKQKGAGAFSFIQDTFLKGGPAISEELTKVKELAQKEALKAFAGQQKEIETIAAVEGLKTSGLSNTQAAAAESIIRSTGGISGTTSAIQRYITNPLKATGTSWLPTR